MIDLDQVNEDTQPDFSALFADDPVETEAAPVVSRDEHGRFAPKLDEPQPEIAPVEAAPQGEPAKAEPVRMTAEEWARVSSQFQQPQPAQAAPQMPEPQKQPDFWDDPIKTTQHLARQEAARIEQHVQAITIEYSRREAVREFGDEVVKQAVAALGEVRKASPAEYARLERLAEQSIDPVGDLIRWHKESTVREKIKTFGNDPEKYIEAEVARRLAERGIEASDEQPQQPPEPMKPRTPLPISLSRLPSGGRRDAGDSSQAVFSSVFN